MIIASHRNAHLRQIAKRGVPITFRRVSGSAPTTTVIEKKVNAVVSTMSPDYMSTSQTGYSSSQTGAMEQNARRIIVMASDLRGAGFPLPIRKNDGVILDTGERLNITSVDAETRAVAGAIDVIAAGVQ